MNVLLQIDFPYEGPFREEMTQAFETLAESIVQESGLIWKMWTENPTTKEAGGIYLFVDHASAEAYLKMHTARLESFGVEGIRSRIFEVNTSLSRITNAPL